MGIHVEHHCDRCGEDTVIYAFVGAEEAVAECGCHIDLTRFDLQITGGSGVLSSLVAPRPDRDAG